MALSGNICRLYGMRERKRAKEREGRERERDRERETERKRERETVLWVGIVARPDEVVLPLNSSSGGGYYFPR